MQPGRVGAGSDHTTSGEGQSTCVSSHRRSLQRMNRGAAKYSRGTKDFRGYICETCTVRPLEENELGWHKRFIGILQVVLPAKLNENQLVWRQDWLLLGTIQSSRVGTGVRRRPRKWESLWLRFRGAVFLALRGERPRHCDLPSELPTPPEL